MSLFINFYTKHYKLHNYIIYYHVCFNKYLKPRQLSKPQKLTSCIKHPVMQIPPYMTHIWRQEQTFVESTRVTIPYIAGLVLHVWRMVIEYCVWRKILKCCAWRLISKHYVWLASGGRLVGAWRASGAMFWNHTSGAMFQNQASDATFQNLPPDAIFCDHASDVYHEWHSVPIP